MGLFVTLILGPFRLGTGMMAFLDLRSDWGVQLPWDLLFVPLGTMLKRFTGRTRLENKFQVWVVDAPLL